MEELSELTELRRSREAIIVRRSIRVITGLLLFLIAILVMSEINHARHQHETQNYAMAINIAGRQRMLTQRIAYLSEVLVTSRSHAVRVNTAFELAKAAEEMRSERDQLIELVPSSEAITRLYEEPPVRLRSRVDDYTAAAAVLAQAELAAISGNHPQYQLVAAASGQLLNDLEAMVTAYQQLLSDLMLDLAEMDRGRVMFVLGGLAAIGLLVVWPGVVALNRYERNLHDRIAMLRQNIQLLKDQQIFNDAMLASVPSALAVYDIESGKTVYLNERYRRLLGYDESDGMVHTLYDLTSLIHAEDFERAQSCMVRAANTGNSTTGIYRLRHKDGVYLTVESRAAALYLRGKMVKPPQLVALIRLVADDELNLDETRH